MTPGRDPHPRLDPVRSALAGLLLGFTAACGAPALTSVPTPPPRPDLPEGWRTITSEEGDLQLSVPGELVVIHTAGAIVGNVEMEAGAVPLEVYAVPPAGLTTREPDQSVLTWLERGGWLPGPNEGATRSRLAERELMLPAGSALEVAAVYDEGTDSASWAVIYVIISPRGTGLVRFSGSGSTADEYSEQIRLIRELITFR